MYNPDREAIKTDTKRCKQNPNFRIDFQVDNDPTIKTQGDDFETDKQDNKIQNKQGGKTQTVLLRGTVDLQMEEKFLFHFKRNSEQSLFVTVIAL